MGEVGVHLQHVAGAVVERVAEAGEVGRADAVLLGAMQHMHPLVLGGQPIGDLAGAVGRAVVDDQHVEAARAPARREHLARGGDDRLDVLGLVVGRQYQPRLAGHESAYPRASPLYAYRRAVADELSNAAIADALEELGDLYELDGAIVHRVLAYRTAAQACARPRSRSRRSRGRPRDRAAGDRQRRCRKRSSRWSRPARSPQPSDCARSSRPACSRSRGCPASGQARAAAALRARHRLAAERCARRRWRSALRTVRGLGPKLEERVLDGARAGRRPASGQPRAVAAAGDRARRGAGRAACAERGGAETQVQLAGSARRRADSVKDIDLSPSPTGPTTLAKSLVKLEQIESVGLGRQGRRARARTHSGIGVDLRIAKPSQRGNLLQHFTGSGRHNAALREAACGAACTSPSTACSTTRSGARAPARARPRSTSCSACAYIEPELREDRGELEAARPTAARLPALIELGDIRGDLHATRRLRRTQHDRRDGARGARARLRVPRDHRPLGDARLRQRRLARAAAPADRARARGERRIDGIELLAGSEVNILPDGSLDYDDELLAQLDWVVASVHTSFAMREQR